VREEKGEIEVVEVREYEEKRKKEGLDRTSRVDSIWTEHMERTDDAIEVEVAVEEMEREEEAYLLVRFGEGVERKKRRVEEIEMVPPVVDVVHIHSVVRIAARIGRDPARTRLEVERTEVAKGENVEIVGCDGIGFDIVVPTSLSVNMLRKLKR